MKNVNIEQGTVEWHALRKQHIGASEISIINGTNPWKTIRDLWKEKTNRKDPDKINDAMRRGINLEGEARNVYMQAKGISMMPSIYFDDKWEIAMASLDGISSDGKIILEIKCPIKRDIYFQAIDKQLPDYYFDQIQWQLMITKAEYCDYMVYKNEFEFQIIKIIPLKSYQEMLVKKAKIFWDHVLSDTPPFFGKEIPKYIENKAVNDKLLKWKQIKKDIEILTKEKEEIEKDIKEKYKDEKNYFFPKAGVQFKYCTGNNVTDWQKVCMHFNIKDKDLESYKKENKSYYKFQITSC